MSNFYLDKIEDLLLELQTSENGLSQDEAAKRLAQSGPNQLPQEKSRSSLEIFFLQFKSPLIYVLFLAAVLTIFIGDHTDTIMIFAAVFLSALVGFFQERKASNALSSLKMVIQDKATVLRDAQKKEILQEKIVIGDIIVLKPGDKVPADARLIEAKDLKTNEASLTGEWLAIDKTIATPPVHAGMADRHNLVYMGTLVESGHAKALVYQTGAGTEIGKIARLISATREEETPYQKKLHHFGRTIAIVVVALSALILVLGVLKGENFIDILLTSIALAVASIPEGLPIAMTVVLALGMQRILKKKGLVRKLSAAESLGSTTIICVDKTGTLTEGKMAVDETVQVVPEALKAAAYCSESYIENPQEEKANWVIRGRPTDRALLSFAIEKNIYQMDFTKNIVDRLEFRSEDKISGSLIKSDSTNIYYLLGAPEKVLAMINEEARHEKLREEFNHLASLGKRVLAAAKKTTVSTKIDPRSEEFTSGLEFLGFISLEDPIRDNVYDSIKLARRAGLKPIMLTGDHILTARNIAQTLGFQISEGSIIDGEELARLSEEELQNRADQIEVYARLEPSQKLKIVSALQKNGEVVAMTGDGVNDAPALKKADIGLALGAGSQVSQEVSDLVLLDNNFSTIVAAIGEGRAIIDNIRKSVVYLIADSFSELFLITLTILLGWPLPVLAAQILWINLIEDGLPTIALAFEPKERDVMLRKPNPKNLPLLTSKMLTLIIVVATTSVVTLALFYFYLRSGTSYDLDRIRTIMFAALALSTLFCVFSCKTLDRNIWKVNPFSNMPLIWAYLAGVLMLVAAIYLPGLQTILQTVWISSVDWILIILVALVNTIVIEAAKYLFNKFNEHSK